MIGKAWDKDREDYAVAICLTRHCELRIHEILRLSTATAQRAIKTGQLTVKGEGNKIRTVSLPRTAQLELEAMLPTGMYFACWGKMTCICLTSL